MSSFSGLLINNRSKGNRKYRGATGGGAGASPLLAPERGGAPLQNEKRDWRISLSLESGIIKPKEIVGIVFLC